MKYFIFSMLLLVAGHAFGQVTSAINAPVAGNFVGFDNTSLIALPIRNGNGPIELYTQPTGDPMPTRRLWLGTNGRLWLNTQVLAGTTFGIKPLSRIGLNIIEPGITPTPEVISARFAPNLGTTTNIGALAFIDSNTPALANQGFRAVVTGAIPFNIGLRALASNAEQVGLLPPANFGVLATAFSSNEPNGINYGVRGEACGGRINIGIYGTVRPLPIDDPDLTCGSGAAVDEYAGYFDGPLVENWTPINPSDQNLKTDIALIENASAILQQLQPVSYKFKLEEYSFMSLPTGKNFGLISQEVEAVLPELVEDYIHPAQFSPNGEVVSDDVQIKGIKYTQLIPILIAALNEQNAQTEEKNMQMIELQAQIDALQQQMSSILTVVQAMQTKTQNCCPFGSAQGAAFGAEPAKAAQGGIELAQNVPNPFDTHTRIDFTLPADAYVVLELSDATGRPLRRLTEGTMAEGPHSINLDGSALAPGVYFYTVYANGAMVTKRMVKR